MLFNDINITYKPTTVYSMLESICNFGKDETERTKLYDLAKVGRAKIFDFDYTLTENISKEEFETNILNHFMTRRIGFETIASFKLHLRNKIFEIMPKYNKMFDAFDEWDLFNDGEVIIKTNSGTDTLKNTGTETIKNSGTDTVKNTGTETLNNTGTNTIDKKNSDMPQSNLENVQNADYLTEYNINTETLNTQNQNTLNTQNQRTLDTQNKNILDTQNQRTLNLTENITKTEKNKTKIYQEFQENVLNIYTMIYKDLECLFYQLI